MCISLVEDVRIKLSDDKFVIFRPIFSDIWYIGLIIFPKKTEPRNLYSLSCSTQWRIYRIIKDAIFTDKYILWPWLHKNVKAWVKWCVHWIYYNTWNTQKRYLHFSLMFTTSLYIINLYIWPPGKISNDTGKLINITTSTCEPTLFLI